MSPVHSLAVALGRVSSAPHLGNTVELALMVKALMSQSQGCERMSTEAGPTPQKLQHLGELALMSGQHS